MHLHPLAVKMIRQYARKTTGVVLLILSLYTQIVGGQDQDTSNATATTLSQFGMVLKGEGASSFSESNTIISKGLIRKEWSPNCGKDGYEGCKLRRFDEYRDQLTFEFFYEKPSLYKFTAPTLTVTGGRARPEVQDFSNDIDEKSGEITIWHNCQATVKSIAEKSTVELSLQLSDGVSVDMQWVKVCGYGEHHKIDFGFLPFSNAPPGNNRGVSLQGVYGEDERTTFGPAVLTTRVYLRMRESGMSQQFAAPRVSVFDAGITDGTLKRGEAPGVEVKGANFGGVVGWQSVSVFDIFYTCRGSGVWGVRVAVGIRPFSNVEMEWRKDCGGGVEQRVNIGTRDDFRTADVVRGGVTREGFAATATAKKRRWGKGDDREGARGRGSGTKAFFVWTTEGKGPYVGKVGIGEISVHSRDERIGRVRIARSGEIRRTLPVGSRLLGEHGEDVAVGGRRVVGVQVRCVRKGRMRVAVTMTMRDRRAVEWWFYNECVRGRRRGPRWTATADGVVQMTMGMFAMVVVWLLARGCWQPSKEAAGRYRRLAHVRKISQGE